ncbi:MAG: VIT1/CCC1 transporter family protein [Verrucomicrobia bacterium]|nr:VIT1/CCC1 transporter family protein [Verrucomicrobiota bacterium]
MKAEHFKGKSVPEHLKEARIRGALASSEVHGTEMPGHFGAGSDAAKDTATGLALLWILLTFTTLNSWIVIPLFAAGWCIWKTGRSALIGWARMERFHRVIEEERWEIEHHRAQERLELTEMYQAKGLTGKLLEEVVDVLMADDNRLLRVMLEEELGLTLEAYEHPLKQAMGALVGSLTASLLCLFGLWVYPPFGLLLFSALTLILSAILSAKLERNHVTSTVIWSLAIATFACGAVYFLKGL